MRNSPILWSRNPFEIFDEMNRWMERSQEPSLASRDFEMSSVATDFHEDEGHFVLTMDVPGMKKEDIKIELQDKVVTISGERKRESFDKDQNQKASRRTERSYGFFQRSFALPTAVEADKVEAHYSDGVLELVIPKAEESKARRIEVQSGKSGIFGRLLNPQQGAKRTDEAAKSEQPSRH